MTEVTVSEGRCMPSTHTIADSTDTPAVQLARMARCLASPDWRPNRTQVAQLIAAAMRSGYEQGREAGLAEAWQHVLDTPEAPPFAAEQIVIGQRQQAHRATYDAWAGGPHRRDHRGGPVEVWT